MTSVPGVRQQLSFSFGQGEFVFTFNAFIVLAGISGRLSASFKALDMRLLMTDVRCSTVSINKR